MKSFSELTSASQVNNEDLVAISQTSGSGYASKKTTVKDITDKSNLNLAEEYDSTSTYAVDDYVIYESVLYKCIGTTTGTFDSTKWTSVVVMDEMGSGGGGGTGGHTIIDENGNSMTARAGLQFVGADVSDDGTNNKTIVDLASAGGIDGVFVDTDNVIKAWTTFTTETTYTATEDCIVIGGISTTSGKTATISVDGSVVYSHYSQNGEQSIEVPIRLKKGQTILLHNETDWANINGYIVYGIQTGTTHSKFQPVIYSLEEREIGVWTDGKPLYEKTIIGTTPSSTGTSVNLFEITSLSIDTLVNTIYEVQQSSNATNDQSAVSVWIRFNQSDKDYIACNVVNNAYTSSAIRVTLQYTKTTDVAGSGTWTPQGVPAHHYSTDEQVIGTWVDGSTLYEKTYVNVLLTNGAENIVDSNFGNDKVLQDFSVRTKGMANTLFNYNSSVSDTLFENNGVLKYYISKTGSWWSALDKVDITIQYTKTS